MDWLSLARGASRLWKRIRGIERLGIRADWELELYGEDGELKDRRTFHNLIVNTGLDALKDRMFNPSTSQALIGYIAVGTGATPETATDTALVTEVVRQALAYTPGAPGVCVVDTTFPASGGYEPAAITEAGMFDAAAAGTMFSRKTFAAVNKTTPDTLKVTVTLTITPV